MKGKFTKREKNVINEQIEFYNRKHQELAEILCPLDCPLCIAFLDESQINTTYPTEHPCKNCPTFKYSGKQCTKLKLVNKINEAKATLLSLISRRIDILKMMGKKNEGRS